MCKVSDLLMKYLPYHLWSLAGKTAWVGEGSGPIQTQWHRWQPDGWGLCSYCMWEQLIVFLNLFVHLFLALWGNKLFYNDSVEGESSVLVLPVKRHLIPVEKCMLVNVFFLFFCEQSQTVSNYADLSLIVFMSSSGWAASYSWRNIDFENYVGWALAQFFSVDDCDGLRCTTVPELTGHHFISLMTSRQKKKKRHTNCQISCLSVFKSFKLWVVAISERQVQSWYKLYFRPCLLVSSFLNEISLF